MQTLEDFKRQFQAIHEDRAAWAAIFGLPYPQTIDDWISLATRAGLSPDFVLKGQWTGRDVMPIIEGYMQHLVDIRATPASEPQPPQSPARGRLTRAQQALWNLLTDRPVLQDEAAEKMNTSVETIRQHVHQIRKAGLPIKSQKGLGIWR
jgi:biotin operon repressor